MSSILEHTSELIKVVGAFIGTATTTLVLIFRYKKRKASEGLHAKSFEKEVRLNVAAETTINTLLAGLPEGLIVSISEWRNKEEPKKFRLKRSTDFNTWSLWKDWQIPEDSLIRIQSITLNEGYCEFVPEQLEGIATQEWYRANGIKKTLSILIGVNDAAGTSLILYVNFKEKQPTPNAQRKLIRLHTQHLHELYKPEGWFAKKNYLK